MSLSDSRPISGEGEEEVAGEAYWSYEMRQVVAGKMGASVEGFMQLVSFVIERIHKIY